MMPPSHPIPKTDLASLARYGGAPLFDRPRSTSSLVPPDFEQFLGYSRIFFEANQYTNNGPVVQLLEQRLAQFHGTSRCVSFCSGFWALALTIKCLAKPGRREVVMPSLTYRRMADVVAWTGLEPRFCEVEPDTLAVSARTVQPALNADTALILGVHPIVNTCDAADLEHLAREMDVPLFIDAVESVYETVGGRKVGAFGDAECFSLHASKLINGFEGGYITTHNQALADQLVRMRGFGFYTPDNVVDLGINAKLNEIHAAMALASLDGLPAQVERNRTIYEAYRQGLASVPGLRLLAFDDTQTPSYKNIVVELQDDWPLTREHTLALLHPEHVLARAYYAPALHQKATDYPTHSDSLPVTDRLAQRFVTLPCGHFVDAEDVAQIVALLAFVRTHAQALLERGPV